MREEIKELLERIADNAMERGKDIHIEWKDYHSTSKTLGSMIDSATTDNGLTLNIYEPCGMKEDSDDD